MELGDHVGSIALPDAAHVAWFEEYFAKLHGRPSTHN